MLSYLKFNKLYSKANVLSRFSFRYSVSYIHSKPVELEEIQYSNEMNTHTFDRLSKVYKLFLNTKRVNNMVYECDKLYEVEKQTLLNDLMQYPRINQDLIRYLFNGFQKIESLRHMLFSDIFKLINMGKNDTVIDIFRLMNQNDFLHKTVYDSIHNIDNDKVSDKDQIQLLLANLLVLQTTLSGDYILASSFALKFKNLDIKITESTLRLIIKTLTLDKKGNSYNNYIIFKLLNTFDLKVGLKHKTQILEYFSRDNTSPFYANIFYDNFLSEEEKKELYSIRKYDDYIFNLISINFEFGNYMRSFALWNRLHHNALIPNASYMLLSKRIIQKLLDSNTSNLENILSVIPKPILANEEIIDLLLIYYGKHLKDNEKFDIELKKLTSPLRRSTLSSLFDVFLSQNNDKAAEKVLQSIFNSTSGINENEFNSIVQKLIKQNNIKDAISMIKKADSDISRLACISILSRLLQNKNTEEFMNNFKEVLGYIRRDNKGHYLETLTEKVISFISNEVSNRASRGIYTKILKLSSKNNLNIEWPLHMEKYGLPDELKYFLRINKINHISCLRIILQKAVIDEDEATLSWAIDEMRFTGMLLHDVLLEIPHNSAFVKKLIKAAFYTCK